MRRLISFSLSLFLAGCGQDVPRVNPAPVLSIGIQGEGAFGAILAKKGDTVWNIAQRYNLPLRDIIDLNDLEPPYQIAEGARLKLPPPVDYTVHAGDTVSSVANLFNISPSQLVKVNKMTSPYRIVPGQTLRVPSLVKAPKPKIIPPAVQDEKIESVELAPVESLPAPPPQKAKPAPLQVEETKKGIRFAWPVRGKVISGYGPKEGGLYNDGMNIAVPKGTPVTAAEDGTVAYVGDDLKSYGNLVLVRHRAGWTTAYAHMGQIRVKKGQKLKQGQVLGTSSTQLHFEVRQGTKAFDPKKHLR